MTSARSSLRATGLSGPATARVSARAFLFRFASSLATTRAANFPNVCIVLPPFIARSHRMKGKEDASSFCGDRHHAAG